MSLRRLTLVMLLAGLLSASCENPENRRRLNLLHEMASDTPVYPDFTVIATSEGAKSTVADITTSYRSGAAFKDVKEFYTHELIPEGVKAIGGRERHPGTGVQ